MSVVAVVKNDTVMGDHQHLQHNDAIDKLQEIVKHQGICMMVTNLKDDRSHSRPMYVSEVDDDGVFWFLSLRTSRKHSELQVDPRVDLHFANPSDQEFLTVHGRAEFLNDRERIKHLFSPWAKAWVPDGAENPDLRLMKVTPEDGYYWDTKNGKVVAGIKILVSMISSRKDDGGVEGQVSV